MKNNFEAAVEHAKLKGIECSAVGWECTFDRLKSLFLNYIVKKNNSGAAKESTLHPNPQSFEEVHELEKNDAPNDPLCVIDSGMEGTKADEDAKSPSSYRKRVRSAKLQVIQDYVKDQRKRLEKTL